MLESLIIPYQPIQTELLEHPAIVQVADVKSTKRDYDYHLTGHCVVIDPIERQGFAPGSAIYHYLSQSGQYRAGYDIVPDLSEAKVSILKAPVHGELVGPSPTDFMGPGYGYKANPGYLGEDSVTALVEYQGQRIKVTTRLVVVGHSDPGYGFEGGGSGGGPALDKKADDCLFRSNRIRRINMLPASALPGTAVAQTTGTYTSGQMPLQERGADTISENGNPCLPPFPAACFVAGTLVHTRDGLRPIEQIKVGDYVLSKPENAKGETTYKRVVNTFEFENKETWFVSWSTSTGYEFTRDLPQEKKLEIIRRYVEDHGQSFVVTTPDHPFWVASSDEENLRIDETYFYTDFPQQQWVRADRLHSGMTLLLADGRLATVIKSERVYKTDETLQGWSNNPPAEPGAFILWLYAVPSGN